MYITVTRTGKDKKNAYVKLMEAYRDADGKKKNARRQKLRAAGCHAG